MTRLLTICLYTWQHGLKGVSQTCIFSGMAARCTWDMTTLGEAHGPAKDTTCAGVVWGYDPAVVTKADRNLHLDDLLGDEAKFSGGATRGRKNKGEGSEGGRAGRGGEPRKQHKF